jgi:hypothetical protein
MTEIPYADECAFRSAVLRPLLVPEPPAPDSPPTLFVLDDLGESVWHPDVPAWHAALAEWGALPAIRRNHSVRQSVDACLLVWTTTGMRPTPEVLIADIQRSLAAQNLLHLQPEQTSKQEEA